MLRQVFYITTDAFDILFVVLTQGSEEEVMADQTAALLVSKQPDLQPPQRF